MSIWLVILGVSVSTFLLRASFIVFADPHRFPKRFRQALTFVPPAVLATIVAPGLLFVEGAFDLTGNNPRWIAGAVAMVVGARTRNALATIATGMAVLWLLQGLMG
ncbi:MAG TPA: AzlD domain-containing protein [Usitatibacter sp.]|nr:AzlD domain-containing protein [Usitatibacter sp.]